MTAKATALSYPRHYFPFPTALPRWSYPVKYLEGKLRGLNIASPFMYTNYDRQDDRSYMRYMTVQSVSSPWNLWKWQGSYYTYRPYKMHIVNYHYSYRI